MTRPPSLADRQRAVDDFNRRHAIGDPLWACTGPIGENPRPVTLRSAAELLSGHTPVAWVNGVSGCVALTHLTPRDPDESDAETCIACEKRLEVGQRVMLDQSGGYIHADCCGPEREGYVNADGEPLGPNDPIPTGFIWEGDQ